jgi:hypothetical protein
VIPDQECQSGNRVGLLNGPCVLLADDHHELLKRVTSILSAEFDVVGSANNGYEFALVDFRSASARIARRVLWDDMRNSLVLPGNRVN